MSQTSTLICGIVQDTVGRPVGGARIVFAAGPVPLPEIAAITGEDGSFCLSAPIPGKYRIACYADGFSSEVVTVMVQSATSATISIRLH